MNQPLLAETGADDALTGIRAAISLVADHVATRVTVHVANGVAILPAAHLLARSRGVEVHPVGSGPAPGDLVFVLRDAGG